MFRTIIAAAAAAAATVIVALPASASPMPEPNTPPGSPAPAVSPMAELNPAPVLRCPVGYDVYGPSPIRRWNGAACRESSMWIG